MDFSGGLNILYPVWAFVFGLLLGSFLNVLVYRLPRRESIVFPGSHCPSCDTPILYRDNIPLFSYLVLGGRCRSCSAKISPRYPLVELSTGCMVAVFFLLQGLTLQFFADVFLGSVLIAAALIDLEHMIIPNRLTYSTVIMGVALSLQGGRFGITRGFHGAMVGLLILLFMYFLGKLLFRRESLGMGDVKLAIGIGLFLGPFWTMIVLALAIVFGGVVGMAQIAFGRKKFGQEIPFGPFIAAGGLCVLFFRQQILFLVERYLDLL